MSVPKFRVDDTVHAIEIINEKRKEVYLDIKAHSILYSAEWNLSTGLTTEERALAWIMVAWRV